MEISIAGIVALHALYLPNEFGAEKTNPVTGISFCYPAVCGMAGIAAYYYHICSMDTTAVAGNKNI